MKKILFLLLITVASYGQTYQNPTFGTVKTMTAPTVTTTPHLGTVETNGVNAKITPENLPLSTATTNALELETTLSAGAFSGFDVTNNGDGTISVGSGIAYLRATNNQYAPLIKYPIAAYNNIPLVDNLNNYIVVSYNGGSPALVLNTTGTGIDTQTNSIAIAAARVGTTVHYVSLVGSNSDPNAKLRNRYLLSEGIRRVAGLAFSATGRKISNSAGITFSGLIRLDVAAMDTNASDTYTLAYNNGSTWTRVTGQTDINNTQYNNGGTLTTLNNNNFRTDYIYALVNSPSKLYVILGDTQYNSLSAARLAPTPSSLPVELQQLGVLIGRAIIEKNASTMEVSSPFTQDFAAGAIENHNDLAGLQGGTAGEYNHLTNAQVALVAGSEQTANKSDSYTVSSTTTYPNTKALVDGLATKQNTLTNPITGTGTTNKLLKWSSSSTASDSGFYDDGTRYAIGTTSPVSTSTLTVEGSNSMALMLRDNSGTGSGFVAHNNIPMVASTRLGYVVFAGQDNASNTFNASGISSLSEGTWTASSRPAALRFETTGLSGGRVSRGYFTGSGNLILSNAFPTDSGDKLQVDGVASVAALKINTTPTTSAGTPPLLTWNSTTKAVESVPYATYATTASPAFTGTPTAPTATAGTNTTQIATTAFVQENKNILIDDASTATSSNVGKLRYRVSGNNSYIDIVMQTGASTYEWVNIVQNNW